MPKGPAIYDPVKHPDRANRERRNTVLALMAEQKYITRGAGSTRRKREPLVTAPNYGLGDRAVVRRRRAHSGASAPEFR